MELSNYILIEILNGITAVQNVDIPINDSYALSQNMDKLLAAYRPYDMEFKKLQAKFEDNTEPKFLEKVAELQQIVVTVDVEPMEKRILEELVTGNVSVSLNSINAMKVYLFTKE